MTHMGYITCDNHYLLVEILPNTAQVQGDEACMILERFLGSAWICLDHSQAVQVSHKYCQVAGCFADGVYRVTKVQFSSVHPPFAQTMD